MIQHTRHAATMKRLVLGAVLFSAGCTASSDHGSADVPRAADADAGPMSSAAQASAAPQATAPKAATVQPGVASVFPEHFRAYSTTPIGQGRECIVGAVSDEDGAGQRPVVIVRQGDDGPVQWTQPLDGIEGMYQTRATHCADSGKHLYVLMQSDTNAAQSLSQTQLSIAKLPEAGGSVPAQYVALPGTEDKAYSAWVDPGAANFRIENGSLRVQARYFMLEDRNTEKNVAIALDLELKPL